jgi:hypothetical protein
VTAPTIRVELGFAVTPSLQANVFVLDDPVQGVLNNATYVLAGGAFVDVSQWLSGQITTQRGRSRETDQYQAGTASFTLRNEDRRFDPSNTASPYYPGIQPRALVNIYVDDVQVFGGYVNDYNVRYEQPNICIVDVSCIDGFCIAANTYLFGFVGAQETTGHRISDVLTTIGYPDARSIDTGLTTLESGTFNNVVALDQLNMAARSEQGFLFVDRTGVMTFFDRHHVLNEQGGYRFRFTDQPPVDIYFDIGYQAITQKSQSLLLYNEVIGTRSGGTQQIAKNTASIAKYLPRQLLLGQLGNLTDAEVLSLCRYLVGRYDAPDVRFDTVTVELQSLQYGASREAVLLADLTDIIKVERTPPGSGTPTTISLLEVIDGISMSFDASASTYLVTFQLGSLDSRAFIVLDHPVLGKLDAENKLAY